MGLLDDFAGFIKTPEGQGLLSATFGGLAGAKRGQPISSLGRAGLAGLSGYSGAQDRATQAGQIAQQKKFQDQQMAHTQFQMDAAKRQQVDEQEIRDAAKAATITPEQARARSMGPTPDGSEPPTVQPGFNNEQYIQSLFAKGKPMQAMQWQAGLQKETPFNKVDAKDFTPESVAKFAQTRNYGDLIPRSKMEVADGAVFDPYNVKPGTILPNANKPFMSDGKGGVTPNLPFQQYEIGKAKAGASNVNVPVNLGQKGLDNTLKVRSDFRSEPIYKAHGEVQSAHAQISTALKQNSPAGDLAGATKLMKILDPGSVVRESELGMAMAASGMLDRVQNYGNMVLSGQKLTPTQRKDFQTLSDALLKESQGQYNAKRDEYKGIAERNQLSVPDILGPEPKIEQKPPTGKTFDSLPNPFSFSGKRMQGPDGKILRSNGKSWVPE